MLTSNDLLDVLSWTRDDDPRAGVAWTLFEQRMGALLQRTAAQAETGGADPERLQELLDRLPRATVRRVLLAPETTRRLRTVGAAVPALSFLVEALETERLVAEDAAAAETRWTADGRARVSPQGVFVQSSLLDCVPVDMHSRYARTIDVAGSTAEVPPRPPYEPEDEQADRKVMSEAASFLEQVRPTAADVVRHCARVAIVQRDDSVGVSSGSAGYYVGRACFANVSAGDLLVTAENLLHEAVHGLLYVQMLESPWVRSDAPGWHTSDVASPWTGHFISARSYLQACFVWFALFHFWRLADVPEAEWHAERARGGFRKGPLEGHLPDGLRDLLTPETRETLAAMRDRMLAG